VGGDFCGAEIVELVYFGCGECAIVDADVVHFASVRLSGGCGLGRGTLRVWLRGLCVWIVAVPVRRLSSGSC
jgi:hypothetical protein